MTRQVNLYEAKTNLSQLVEDAAKGEEIIIAKNGKPLAMLKALPKPIQGARQFGQLKGKVWLAPDFDAADAEIERLFYEGDLNDPASDFKPE